MSKSRQVYVIISSYNGVEAICTNKKKVAEVLSNYGISYKDVLKKFKDCPYYVEFDLEDRYSVRVEKMALNNEY